VLYAVGVHQAEFGRVAALRSHRERLAEACAALGCRIRGRGCRVHLKAMAPRVINPRAAVETIGGTEALFCHAERLELSRD
jgi:hypothetical protein